MKISKKTCDYYYIEKYDSMFKKISGFVSGLEVLNGVPNTDSISATTSDYDILRGIREVPFSVFTQMGPLSFYSTSEKERTYNLAKQIKESKQIKPLIVMINNEGPYILEGGHRFDALRILNIPSFPALVVIDNESVNVNTASLKHDLGGGTKSFWITPDYKKIEIGNNEHWQYISKIPKYDKIWHESIHSSKPLKSFELIDLAKKDGWTRVAFWPYGQDGSWLNIEPGDNIDIERILSLLTEFDNVKVLIEDIVQFYKDYDETLVEAYHNSLRRKNLIAKNKTFLKDKIEDKIFANYNKNTINYRKKILIRADYNRRVVFTAIVLTEESKKALFNKFPPKHKNVQDGHVTLQFHPVKLPENLGEKVNLKVYGYANDDKIDVVSVILYGVESQNTIPHITLSTSNNTKPSYSNELLQKGYGAIEPFELTGYISAYMGSAEGYITAIPEPPAPVLSPPNPVPIQRDSQSI